MAEIEGCFFDGRTSASRPARLLPQPNASIAVVDPDGGLLHDPVALAEVEVSSRLGNSARYLVLPGGAKFETRDNDGIDSLLAEQGGAGRHNLLHQLESRLRYVLAGVAVVLLTGWLTLQYGVPALSTAITVWLPPEAAEQMGERALALMDQHYFQPSQLPAGRREALQAQFKELFATEIAEHGVALEFRHSEALGANAFALPSAQLVFTDDIVALAGSDEELQAVMAHEMGHVVHRHGMRSVVQDSLLVFLAALVLGDVSGISSFAVSVPAILLELGYSRRFEREADDYAWQALRDRDIATVHFSNMMARLDWDRQRARGDGQEAGDNNERKKRKGGVELEHYLSTHPPVQERIEKFGAPNVMPAELEAPLSPASDPA